MYMAPSGSLPVAWTWPGAGTVGLTTRRPKQAFGYGAAGLTLVANRELSGLAVTPVSTVPDIAIVVDARPAWSIRVDRSVSEAGAADPLSVSNVRVDRSDDGLAFVYTDGCRFWIDRRGDTIWMTFDTTLEDACTYLVGPVLSSALRLRGDYSLHASAVRFARGAVAFAGPHGAGKSTLAAALGRAGHPVIADDVLRLTNHDGWWRAHPFGGILRLWPSGVKTVFGDQEMLESITPTWDKRALPIGASGVPGVSEALPCRRWCSWCPVTSTACHSCNGCRRERPWPGLPPTVRPATCRIGRHGFVNFIKSRRSRRPCPASSCGAGRFRLSKSWSCCASRLPSGQPWRIRIRSFPQTRGKGSPCMP